jgi:hypothetical protein
MTLRRRLALLFALALTSALLACNGLLGNRDAVADDDGDGGAEQDSSVESTSDAPSVLDASDESAVSAPDAKQVDASSFDAIPPDAPYTAVGGDTNGPTDLAVDNDHVYWINPTKVLGCPKSGCTGSPVQYASGTGLTAIAANASWLYWTDGNAGTVSVCAPANNCSTPITMSGFLDPRSIALSPTTAFWGERGGNNLDYCPLGQSCTPPSAYDVITAGAIAWGPFDGGSLYYIEVGQLRFCPVSKCASGSGAFNVFAAAPFDVAASASPTGVPVCVTVPAPYGEIFCIFDFGTSAVAHHVATSKSPLYIAVDDPYVYWVDSSDLALERCLFNGPCAAPQVIATFPDLPGPFVIDGTTIFGVVTGAFGFIYKMPKP